MNTTEELLKQAYNALKLHFEPVAAPPQEKRWKPKEYEQYLFVNAEGYFLEDVWINGRIDNNRYATGNCYQLHEKERAIWEQVTRRKYEQALKDAADWVSGQWNYGVWDDDEKRIKVGDGVQEIFDAALRFATKQSCLDAHTRILGNDAKRYFTGGM